MVSLVLLVASLVVSTITLLQLRALLAPRQQLFLLQEITNLAIAMSDQMAAKHHLPKDRRLNEAVAYARELAMHLKLHVKDATLRKTIEAVLNRR